MTKPGLGQQQTNREEIMSLRTTRQLWLAVTLSLTMVAQVGAATLWGTAENTGNIFSIDTDTLIATQVGTTTDVVATPDEVTPNSNALDVDNQRFYFTTFELVSSLVALPSQLYFNDLAGTNHYAGELAAGTSSGAFHSGKFYYIAHGSDDLRQVTFDAAGMKVSDIKLLDVTKNRKIWGFGDIAIANNGVLYGSSTIRGPAPGGAVIGRELFRYKFSTGEYLTLAEATCENIEGSLVCTGAWWGQIAFADDGQLWGHDTNTGTFFTIDLTTGAHSDPLFDLGMTLTDLASSPPPPDNMVVTMDLVPKRYPNNIRLNNRGTVKVAILGSADFDVSEIDPGSLSLAGMPVKVKRNGLPICKIRDMSGNFDDPRRGLRGLKDGYPDLYCQFLNSSDLWTDNGDGTATLTGTLYDGTIIEATDEFTVLQ